MKLLNTLRLNTTGRISASWLSSWRPDCKRPGGLIAPLLSAVRLVQGSITRSIVIQVFHFSVSIARITRRQGLKGLVLYLKTAQVMLMTALPGSESSSNSRAIGKVAVASTRDGLPRLIPKEARVRIRRLHLPTIRLWLTLFGLYRVLTYPGTLKIETITAPGKVINTNLLGAWTTFSREYLRMLSEKADQRLLDLEPSTHLVPRVLPITSVGASSLGANPKNDQEAQSSWESRFAAARQWVTGVWGDSLWEYLWHVGQVDKTNTLWDLIEYEAEVDPLAPCRSFRGKTINGRLSTKEEAAGKIRVFAIVDYWTQVALRPLHDFLMSALKGVDQDGTHDQVKPLKALLKRISADQRVYSFDLSAATDRLPVSVQWPIIANMFYDEFADSWKQLLVGRTYFLDMRLKAPTRKRGRRSLAWIAYLKKWTNTAPRSKASAELIKRKEKRLTYAVGQPMGAYSSWAMLAMTHHMIVQFSYRRTGGTGWFRDYAVLGDDIVIADDSVAAQYRVIMAEFGVEIGLAKSLVSRNRTCEFAKRFFVGGVDCSGLPWNLWSVSQQTLSAAVALLNRVSQQGIKLTPASLSMAFGAGWRASSRTGASWKSISKRISVLLVAVTHPSARTSLSRNSWIEWLVQHGPALRVTLGNDMPWFTPWATGLLTEYVVPLMDRLETQISDLFFGGDTGEFTSSSPHGRGFTKRSRAAALHNADVNKKLLAAQDALEKSQASLSHLQRLNIRFMLHQASAVFTQVVNLMETRMAAVPKLARDLRFERSDKVRFPSSGLYTLWNRWRGRACGRR
nr:MAG: putative RNA-dependent RNA polymerase [Mitoviridae sp.]